MAMVVVVVVGERGGDKRGRELACIVSSLGGKEHRPRIGSYLPTLATTYEY